MIELSELLEYQESSTGTTPVTPITCPQGMHPNVATSTEVCCTRCEPDGSAYPPMSPESQEIRSIQENMAAAPAA